MSKDKRTSVLTVNETRYAFVPIADIPGFEQLPYALRIVLENIVRNAASQEEAHVAAKRVVDAAIAKSQGSEVEFSPARVLFQDFTGVPVFVDFAAMREACASLGGDPARINPGVPCNLVIDHSVIADEFGCEGAQAANEALEFERNAERYAFLKWAQKAFQNVEITPPGQGICHQLNIEQFASVVMTASVSDEKTAGSSDEADDTLPLVYFDTVVGTDSHTPTVNGLGVLGWGVGGIEAEAAALGQPITTLVPRVVGVHMTGSLSAGVSAMDVALHMAALLRGVGVVGSFVECFGEGVAHLSATQRACIANMTPEYGCTSTLFPVDDKTLEYLRVTGRSEEAIQLVEAYAKAQGLWLDDQERVYASVIEVDLSKITRNVAGPSRPHERIAWSDVAQTCEELIVARGASPEESVTVEILGVPYELSHAALAIAAITSCTTATDPSMMLACGLLARNAAARGLTSKPWVKTILAPGSRATELLLKRAGLVGSLQKLGFYTCGFGCMSCIGNSGPILPALHEVAGQIELASVLSGNRNFEGRISPDVSQNYLSAPAGVVAYALAGTMRFDFETTPLGKDHNDEPVYLRDIWPSDEEIASLVSELVTQDLYLKGAQQGAEEASPWNRLSAPEGQQFGWDSRSTYVRRAPYFEGMTQEEPASRPVEHARVLALLGDFITTDHISPAGVISADSAAARYLRASGVDDDQFNAYGARRGNHEVMMRGTFANVKLENALATGKRGGWTRNMLTGDIELIYDAAESYRAQGIPLVVLAGKMYGSGSSRDWAAKGPYLLGVRAVIAESFERIHRSNLVGMGILPLQFQEGENTQTLGLDGTEEISIDPVDFSDQFKRPLFVDVHAKRDDGTTCDFTVQVRVDTPTEAAYCRAGGILQYVLRNMTD